MSVWLETHISQENGPFITKP